MRLWNEVKSKCCDSAVEHLTVIWLNIVGGCGPGCSSTITIRPQYTISKVASLSWPSVILVLFCYNFIFDFATNSIAWVELQCQCSKALTVTQWNDLAPEGHQSVRAGAGDCVVRISKAGPLHLSELYCLWIISDLVTMWQCVIVQQHEISEHGLLLHLSFNSEHHGAYGRRKFIMKVANIIY